MPPSRRGEQPAQGEGHLGLARRLDFQWQWQGVRAVAVEAVGSGQAVGSESGNQSAEGKSWGFADSNFQNHQSISRFVMRNSWSNSVLIVLATLAVAAAQKGQGADGNPHGKRP